jgi:hypothetical protein
MQEYIVYWGAIPTDTATFDVFKRMAKANVSQYIDVNTSDTSLFFRYGEGETFMVKKDDKGSRMCNTGHQAYTRDVMKCLIIMVELGMAKGIGVDDTNVEFLQELETLNTKFGLKTYAKQKKYFEDNEG